MLLVTNVDQVVTYGTISGNDCTLIDVETRDTTDKEVVSDFTVTGDRLNVKRYFKNGYVDGDANARVFNMTGVDNALFEDCIFMTKVTTGILNFTGTACTNVVAKKCVFYVKSTTTGAKNIVDTVTGSTYVSFECTDLSSGAITTGNISTVTDALYGGNGIASFPASAAPANNVSIAEVIRDIWDSLRNGTGGSEPGTNLSIIDELKKGSVDIANPRYISLAIDMTSATWNTAATHEILTVTGLVRLRLWIECTDTLTDAGNGATIQLGVEGTTNAFIAASDTDNVVTGSIWADNTPGDTNGNFSSLVLDKVVNGLDVGYEIANEAVTGGALKLHCVWEPLNATGAVVVGAGGVL